MSRRTALIAGGGPAGIFLAVALAQRDWQVTVFEKSDALRMYGAGIFLWENGLQALEAIGAYADTVSESPPLSRFEVKDEQRQDQLVIELDHVNNRFFVPTRAALYEALLSRAAKEGVRIETSAPVAKAEPAGTLVLENGRSYDADLVVGADGVHSRVRDGLALTKRLDFSSEGYTRMLVERRPEDPPDVVTEYWSGSRRLLAAASSYDQVYIATTCRVDDLEARRVPVVPDVWRKSFPDLGHFVERMVGRHGRWDQGTTVTPRRWSVGQIAIIGDAAHGQLPNLAQGANSSFMNALSLAVTVTEGRSVPGSLQTWEEMARPLTQRTQWWSKLWGRAIADWPVGLVAYRGMVLTKIAGIGWVNHYLTEAQMHPPLGNRIRGQ